MEPLLRVLGQNILRERRRKGWSQEFLATRSHLHRTYIGGIERGERNVSIRNVEKIAAALGVDPYLLLMSADERPEDECSQ